MRKLAFWALLSWGIATQAAPVVWVVTPALLSDGTTVSGNFTYDSSTTLFSNIALTATGTAPATYGFVAGMTGPPTDVVFQTAAVVTPGMPILVLQFPGGSGLPEDGAYTQVQIQNYGCTVVSGGGLCMNVVPNEGYTGTASDATITGSPLAIGPGGPGMASPKTVPTLGEYALLGLVGLVALATGWGRRLRPWRAGSGLGAWVRHR